MIRLAHATDLHWFSPPRPGQISPKRIFGSFNLMVMGRAHHFDPSVQRAAVQAMVQAAPDVAVITGDLTAQALPEEFALARRDLDPLLTAVPTLVQNGNHDVYTGGSARADRIAEHFGPWLHRREGGIARLDCDWLTILGLDPCRPHWSASGVVPDAQLRALAAELKSPVMAERVVVLAQHYPVLHPSGALYDKPGHGLRNARALVEVLRAAPVKPAAILHGHRHHGYTVDLDLGDVAVPIFNPGTGGQTFEPDLGRAASVNLYDIERDGSIRVQRARHDGTTFVPEPGGAYASGG